MSFYNEEKRRIRKIRRCFGCGRPFPVGTVMIYVVGSDGSDLCANYECETCNLIIKELVKDRDFDIETLCYGDLYYEAIKLEEQAALLVGGDANTWA